MASKIKQSLELMSESEYTRIFTECEGFLENLNSTTANDLQY